MILVVVQKQKKNEKPMFMACRLDASEFLILVVNFAPPPPPPPLLLVKLCQWFSISLLISDHGKPNLPSQDYH